MHASGVAQDKLGPQAHLVTVVMGVFSPGPPNRVWENPQTPQISNQILPASPLRRFVLLLRVTQFPCGKFRASLQLSRCLLDATQIFRIAGFAG